MLLLPSSGLAESPEDVALTWTGGKVVLPRSVSLLRTRTIGQLAGDLASLHSTPAIVYIHGSDGVNDGTIELARSLSDGGFAVFMPDSYKRPGRVNNCDSVTHLCNRWPDTYRHRNEEIVYAASAIQRVAFIDPKRVVLLGHSEGGIAAAHYAGDFYAGIVISGWYCGPWTRGRDKYLGDFAGIKSPPNVPILSIHVHNDPWYAEGGGLNGDCSRYFAGRTSAKAILDPGNIHYILPRRDIIQAVIDFAQSVTRVAK